MICTTPLQAWMLSAIFLSSFLCIRKLSARSSVRYLEWASCSCRRGRDLLWQENCRSIHQKSEPICTVRVDLWRETAGNGQRKTVKWAKKHCANDLWSYFIDLYGADRAGLVAVIKNSDRLPFVNGLPLRIRTKANKVLFRYLNSPPNSTMQKEDSPSHQNVGTYMEY
jgi:hypothetical protein